VKRARVGAVTVVMDWRVVATGAEGVAAQQPPHGFRAATGDSVVLDCLHTIIGAGGKVAAGRAASRGEVSLIPADEVDR
jgi:hypothetical protein